jgi:hypothetical protein
VRTLEVELDFAQHRLPLTTSTGASAVLALAPCSVSEFHAAYLAALRGLGPEVSVWPLPVEIADAVPFPEDRRHASYDREYADRFWRIVIRVDRALKRFGGRSIVRPRSGRRGGWGDRAGWWPVRRPRRRY